MFGDLCVCGDALSQAKRMEERSCAGEKGRIYDKSFSEKKLEEPSLRSTRERFRNRLTVVLYCRHKVAEEMVRPNQKPLLIIAARFFLASFVSIFLHHHRHEDGDDHDCSVCHFVKQIASFFGLVLSALVIASVSCRKFLLFSSERLKSFLLASKLLARSPPSLLLTQ